MKIRLLTQSEVELSVLVQFDYECDPISTGDPELDEMERDWRKREIAAGNPFAWCVITVSATWGDFYGHDTVGGNSFKDVGMMDAGDIAKKKGIKLDSITLRGLDGVGALPEAFIEDYFGDLVKGAVDHLNDNIQKSFASLKGLIMCDPHDKLDYTGENVKYAGGFPKEES